MSGGGVKSKVKHNDRTMANTLPSTQSQRHRDHCRGIHGAAKARASEKHGTVCARRRHDKEVIQAEVSEMQDVSFCNECGQPALYWDKGWDDEEWGMGDPESFWCEEHKNFKVGAELINPLPTTCCMNVGGHGTFQSCGKTATHWYHHNEDVCSYCDEHDYQCGEPLPFTNIEEPKP